MFEVLAFVYENYWRGDACPTRPALQRKLNAVGFDDAQVQLALVWLEELRNATRCLASPVDTQLICDGAGQAVTPDTTTTTTAMRVLTTAEQARLGCAGWGLLVFLISAGVLPWERLELVMDRAMATTGHELSQDDLKLIVLMVFWSLGEEPDALVLDELCDNRTERIGH